MRTIRALAAFTIVTTGAIVAAAGPVAAKGPESVTLTGPGIDGTIVVGAWGAADQNTSTDFPAYLHLALRQLTDDLLFDADATLEILTDSPEPPPGREDLGPKYTLTWTMSGPPDADPAAYTVVQELYPEPSFNRSYIRTLANPYTDSPDKWFVVDPVLADILDAYSASPTAQTVTTPTPTPASTHEPSSGIHPLATLAAATATFATGLTLGPRRRWQRATRATT